MARSVQHTRLKMLLILAASAFVSAGKGFNANGEKDNGKRKLNKKKQRLKLNFLASQLVYLIKFY